MQSPWHLYEGSSNFWRSCLREDNNGNTKYKVSLIQGVLKLNLQLLWTAGGTNLSKFEIPLWRLRSADASSSYFRKKV